MKVEAIPAATVMLTRDHRGSLEVLLVRRNKSLSFAGGLWVFPGGKIDDDELAKSANTEQAAAMAAVREAKEETNLRIDYKDLVLFRHWTTPEGEPRRFATWFYFSVLKAYQQEVIIDNGEIKDYQWINPQAALLQLRAGELPMINPTILSLSLIKNCKTTKEAERLLKGIDIAYILPVLCYRSTIIIALYKGDAGYNTGNPDQEGARHRFTFDLDKHNYYFEYENCEEEIPVLIA